MKTYKEDNLFIIFSLKINQIKLNCETYHSNIIYQIRKLLKFVT